MKRFHVHVHVDDLARNVAFYSAMFGTQPARVEPDYAKWMLDEPAVNFAISTRGHGHLGVDHLGIQVDNEEDLSAMKAQAQAADMALIDEGATSCCYARSDKHWIVDPQGLPWEHFRTLGTIPVFSGGEPEHVEASAPEMAATGSACCAPRTTGKPIGIPVKSASTGCC
ncbi:MAG: ArsI/CadI family heavy metal resistance metalloenzyme [Aquabacterium sp.]|jgi:catechol 2,3-dioxygenase-like lactoylglutathione lyase family enzyme|uniref:ArsI/CadI family heavy metal resistance metalloenzyme n=1 Tax=Aquabacterium sp. TaxID=1872578 RepID=UPI003BB131A6